MLPPEPEVLDARRGFIDAQARLIGVPDEGIPFYATCGWYGTALHDERGSFALVDEAGPLSSMIGDRILLTAGLRNVVVYAFGSTDLPHDVAITRRAFMALDLLTKSEIEVLVSTVRS